MYNVLKFSENDEIMSKINLQEPQRNRNATAFFVNLTMTSTVHMAGDMNSINIKVSNQAFSEISKICNRLPLQ